MSQLAQRLIMAAGGAKKDSTYVDDVFSTYLYKGNADNVIIGNGIKLSNANGGFGVAFNSSQSDGIYSAGSDGFKFETGDFTVEYWMYTDFSGTGQVIDARGWGHSGDSNWSLSIDSSNNLRFFAVTPSTGGDIRITNNTTLNANTWYHIALVRSSGTTKMYIDGVQQTQTFADANNYTNTTLTFGIHGPNHSSFPLNGKLSNVRVVKGTAVYTSNFTPPTENLTNISGTELLCFQSSATPITTTVDSSTLLYLINTPVLSSGPFTGEDAKGGLVWIKNRTTAGYGHFLFDTERGTTKAICTNLQNPEFTETKGVNSFNTDGFTIGGSGGDAAFNANNSQYASWTFAKQEGFFDIVTWNGNNTPRTIPHNLGSIPGCIMVKRIDSGSEDWHVYHQGINELVGGPTNTAGDYYLYLNTNNSYMGGTTRFNDTAATATEFSVGTDNGVNASGGSYIAYIFAGGASDQPGSARSIDFDGSGDYLSLAATTDLNLTGDFTIEFWVYPRSQSTSRQTIMQTGSWGSQYAVCQISNQTQSGLESKAQLWDYDMNQSYAIAYSNSDVVQGVWTHVAFTRQSGTIRVFLNGNLDRTFTGLNDSIEFGHTTALIGNHSSSWYLNAKLSNFRIVNGTAVYTSSFTPPTQGLTNITNTKLLCCNKNTVTGSTVTPGTITSHGDPQSILATPFDDLEGYKFGGGGDQSLIKCGTFIGNSNADGPEVYLGWEPQFIIFKPISGSENWGMYDCMRGIVTKYGSISSNDMRLLPNTTHEELTNFDGFSLTSTGFKITSSNALINPNGTGVIYIAIRRPDGLVGKPPAVGKDVFAVDSGNQSSVIPCFESEFPVDFAPLRRITTSSHWEASSRLTAERYVVTSDTAAEYGPAGNYDYDSNIGYANATWANHTYLAWMWRRHAGFDVQCYTGTGANAARSHKMGIAPEMIWVKKRGGASDWVVYHKDLDTYPQDYYLKLNTTDLRINGNQWWKPTTNTHWFTAGGGLNNVSGAAYISYHFASVKGICKVGSFDGNNTSMVVTTGFQPRFIMVKAAQGPAGYGWFVWDYFRGLGAGDDPRLDLNSNNQQDSGYDYFNISATGFSTVYQGWQNQAGAKFIYYAHA